MRGPRSGVLRHEIRSLSPEARGRNAEARDLCPDTGGERQKKQRATNGEQRIRGSSSCGPWNSLGRINFDEALCRLRFLF